MPGGPCRRNQRKQMKQMEMRRLHGSPGLCTFFQLPAVARQERAANVEAEPLS